MLATKVLQKRGVKSLIAQDKALAAGLLGAFRSSLLMIQQPSQSAMLYPLRDAGLLIRHCYA